MIRRVQSLFLAVMLLGISAIAHAQTNNYYGTTGALSGSVWSTNLAGPYTSALNATGGAIINFGNAASLAAGANTIVVAGINATANFSITGSPSGTISNFNNGVIPINVSDGVTLDFGTQSFTISGTAGYIFNGNSTGVLALAGNTYGGGFTLNSGTVIIRGVNAMGGNATTNVLTINGGTLAANATRDLTGKYSNIVVGGNFTLGATTGLALSAASLTFSNTMNLGAATRTITIGGTGVYSLGGVISGAAGTGLAVNATAGGVIALSGVNTYDGGTTINSGILAFRNTASQPVTGMTTVAVAGTLGLGVGGAGFFTSADVDSLFANTLAGVTMDPAATVGIDTTAGNFTYATAQATRAITKLGINTLSLTGANTYTSPTIIHGGTLQLGDGITDGSVSGNIVNNATLSYNLLANTTITNSITGIGGLTKLGNAALTLGSATSYTGSTNVAAGLLVLNNSASTYGSLTTNPGFNVGTGFAAVRFSAGSILGGPLNPGFIIGLGAGTQYGAFEMSGGTVQFQPTGLNTARFSFRKGYGNFTGGSFAINYTGNGAIAGGDEFIVGNGGTDRGVIYATGGTVNISMNALTGSALVVGDTLTTNGGSDLTISGTADWTVSGNTASGGTVRLSRATATHTGTLNLNNGGRLTTNGIIKGTGAALLNFDGGILRAGIANANFIPSTLTSARIYSGGATIDAPFNVTIAEPLLAPTGNVVTSIPVAMGGSGYFGAPIVTILGGGGTGATAIANYDPATGTVTSITITSPGDNYTNVPTVSLYGGTTGTPATLDAAVTAAAVATGGLTKNGNGILTLSGANTYGGTTTINAGMLTLSATGTLGAGGALALNGGALDLGTLSQSTGAVTITAAAIGNTIQNGSLTAPSYSVSNAAGNAIVTANLLDFAVSTLTKTGAGRLTLSGVNAYTGATNVSQGSLFVTGTLDAASAVSMASSTTLGGTGFVNGTATIANGGTVEAGSGGTGTLTLGGLAFAGTATLNIGTLASYTTNPSINVTGSSALSTTGANSISISISNLAGTSLLTPYNLITYASSIGGSGFAAFTLAPLPSRTVGALSNTGSAIQLTLTGTDFIVWTGAANLANGWDTATNNWKLNSNNSPTAYINSPPDVVMFNDSVSPANTAVSINAATVSPNRVTFDNTLRNYTLQGTSGIAGSTGLTKTGAGSLTITNVNTYTGVTALNGGTTSFVSGGLGSGDITFAGGTLHFATGNTDDVAARIKNSGAAITLDPGSNAVVLAGSLADTNTAGLTKLGTGTLTLAGANAYLGTTTIANGTLALATGNNRLPTATTLTLGDATFNTSGAFKIDGRSQSLAGLLTAGTGTGNRVINGSATASVLTLNIAASNDFTGILGGTGTDDNNFGLTKTGDGTLTLSSVNTYTGVTAINAGTLSLNGSNRIPTANTIAFNGNATLDLGAHSQSIANLTVGNSFTGTVTGATGSLTVTGTPLQIGSTAGVGSQTLNLSGLASFTYSNIAGTFNVGTTVDNATASATVVTLAGSNIITAATLNVALSEAQITTTPNAATLNLGQTNVIIADTIAIGSRRRANGLLQFQPLTNPSLTIAGATTARANMVVGSQLSAAVAVTGTVDLSAGTLTAMISTLTIGQNARGASAGTNATSATGSFTMGGGTLDATSVVLGQVVAGTDSTPASLVAGTFTFGVGSGTMKVATLTLGDMLSTSTTVAVTATVNLDNGGTINAQTIQPGAPGTAPMTRTINWNDGTITTFDAATDLAILAGIDVKLADTGTHTFNIGFERTATVGAAILDATTGGTLTKAGPGSLILTNTNTHTGTTTVTAGTLALSGNGSIAASPTLTLGTGSVLNVNVLTGGANFNGTNFTLAAGQTLAGRGTVNASVVGFAAPAGTTIAPGTSAGTLAITGNSILSGAYNFEVEAAGIGSAGPLANGTTPLAVKDLIAIAGTADVTGLVVNIASIDAPPTGFNNTLNYSWTILTSTGLTGTPTLGTVTGTEFSNPGTGVFSLATDANNVYLNFTQAVPEPLAVLALASLSLFVALRSRRS